MFRMDGAWHFKHGAVHWVYLASLLATTDESKTSASAVMACDTAGDSLLPFLLSSVSWLSALLMDACSYAYMCFRTDGFTCPAVDPVFTGFVLHTKHRFQKKRRTELNIFAMSFFSACLRWVVVELRDHKLAPDLSWVKNSSSVLVEPLNDSGTNAWMQTSNPLHSSMSCLRWSDFLLREQHKHNSASSFSVFLLRLQTAPNVVLI